MYIYVSKLFLIYILNMFRVVNEYDLYCIDVVCICIYVCVIY